MFVWLTIIYSVPYTVPKSKLFFQHTLQGADNVLKTHQPNPSHNARHASRAVRLPGCPGSIWWLHLRSRARHEWCTHNGNTHSSLSILARKWIWAAYMH